MDIDKQRELNRDKTRANIIKARLRNYREDLELLDSLKVRVGINRDKMDLQSGWSNRDAVQGGGTSQEDRLNKLLDKIRDDERTMKMIELENRALSFAIETLPDEDMKKIIYHVWVCHDRSMEQLGRELHLSKTSIWRKSDAALLDIYRKLYILTPEDVDPR